MYLFFDTETNGLPKDNMLSHTIIDNWPRLVSISWSLQDYNCNIVEEKSFLINSDGWTIPQFLTDNIHGISNEDVKRNGVNIKEVLSQFYDALIKADYVVGHNIRFDRKVVAAEFYRYFKNCHYDSILYGKRYRDTMHASRKYIKILNKRGNIKLPKLQEMYTVLFGHPFENEHNANADIIATSKCFWKLDELGLITEYYKTHKDFSIHFHVNK
jgi:DNA polymerase III epsilon subunit-like protein